MAITIFFFLSHSTMAHFIPFVDCYFFFSVTCQNHYFDGIIFSFQKDKFILIVKRPIENYFCILNHEENQFAHYKN